MSARRSGWPGCAAMLAAGIAWMAFCLWTFNGFSSPGSSAIKRFLRAPDVAMAMLGAGLIFASACLQWRSRRPILAACLWHAAGVVLALCPFLLVGHVLTRAPPPWRPSADDAMGTGILYLMLCGLATLSLILLAIALALRRARGYGRGDSGIDGRR